MFLKSKKSKVLLVKKILSNGLKAAVSLNKWTQHPCLETFQRKRN